MTAPKRIQRRRVKGWRKPANCIIVDRTSRWGNRWRITRIRGHHSSTWTVVNTDTGASGGTFTSEADARADAVLRYRFDAARGLIPHIDHLTGFDLACTCDPADGMACHADVLLELANPEEPHAR